MLSELLDHPGVVERVELRSTFGFMAFHGGSLERVTDEIAEAAAEQAGASLYAVIQPPTLRWHVPSTSFDPAQSTGLQAFLDHVDVAVAVHGYGRTGRFTTLLLGGRNRALAAHVAGPLRRHLTDYDTIDDLAAIPRELAGQHPQNPVNLPAGGGVQLELPPRVRGLGPYWDDQPPFVDGRSPHTHALIDALADAARTWPATPHHAP
jgi:phage replication-related protein YjqB (UPF0714/DUF867 family)